MKAASWTESCRSHTTETRTDSELCYASGKWRSSFVLKNEWWTLFKAPRAKTPNQEIPKDKVQQKKMFSWTFRWPQNRMLGGKSLMNFLMGRQSRLETNKTSECTAEEWIAHQERKLIRLKNFRQTRSSTRKELAKRGNISRKFYFYLRKNIPLNIFP